jgi:chorismate mutase-like protein
MRDLADIRKEINAIDDEIIALLARRFALLPEVVAYKQAHGLPAVIPERVQEVLDRNAARAEKLGLDAALIRAVYERIIDAYCRGEAEILH